MSNKATGKSTGQMACDSMSGGSFQTQSMPLSRYPGPACSYALVDGDPVIGSTNGVFERTFGAGIEDSPVPVAFERLGIHAEVESTLSGHLQTGEPFHVRAGVGAESYVVQTVVPAEGDTGFLLFVANPGESDQTLGIDHVASVVSHDLRNPLDVAKARLEAGRELDEDEHFDHVAQAHERMERIIQDVLTIARGPEVVDPDEPVDLTGVARTAWATVETDGATLRVEDDLPTAIADSDRVGRLFENLFRNAVEHGSPDSPGDHDGTTVRVGQLADSDGFYVGDNGPGIAPENRTRVLEPGYSSDDHGTGLGLAIVARIADIHDWTVEVTESDAGGARVEVGGVDSA